MKTKINTEVKIPESIKRDLELKGGLGGIIESLPDDKKIKISASIFHALSAPSRLRVLYALTIQPMCVCLLVELMGHEYSKMSYHLSALKECGLISSKQEGNFLIYHPTELGKRIVDWVLTFI